MGEVNEPATEGHHERLREEMSMILSLPRLIHEPSRLKILTLLRPNGEARYTHLWRATAISKANLSNHLRKLEEAGLIDIGKHFEGKTPVTTARLTPEGRRAIDDYWNTMALIARRVRGSRPRKPLRWHRRREEEPREPPHPQG